MSDSYDVIVVGAGPAGSIAAKTAAKNGARTLLLERDPVIGTPVRCGEVIMQKNLQEFIPVQERWIAAYIDHAYLFVPSGESIEIVGNDDRGIILERNIFDRYLAELAAEEGADIITRADVNGLIYKNGRIGGLHYTRFGTTIEVEADVVIGADGIDSRVGRWAGINTQLALRDLGPTYQFIVAGVEFDPTSAEVYFGSQVGLSGYIWIVPKSRRTVLVGIGYSGIDTSQGSAYERLLLFLHKRFPKASIVGEMAGGVPAGAPIKRPVKDGLILAGDAARHCNPLTGEGIYTAMFAGYHAGQTAASAIADGDVSAKRLSAYGEVIKKKIEIPNRRAHSVRRALAGVTDSTLNITAHEINLLKPDERTLGVILFKVMKNHPGVILNAFKSILSEF